MSILLALIRAIPTWLRDSLWDLAYRPHTPYDVAGDGTGPAWCLHCDRAWPCREASALIEQRDRWAS